MHNAIRKDRYHPTQYTEEMETLEIKQNGAYTEHDNQLATNWQPHGNQLATTGKPNDNQTVSESSIDKNRVGKNSLNNNTPSNIPQEFDILWAMYPPYRKQGKKRAIEAYRRARKAGTSFEEVKSGLESYVRYIEAEHIEDQFIKQGGTFFTQNAWDGDWKSRRMESDDLDGIL
jgi:hypothetical protein